MSDIAAVMKACEAIEAQLVKFADKTEAELKNAGSTSADTKAAVDGLSIKQRELADRILQIEQNPRKSRTKSRPQITGAISSSNRLVMAILLAAT